MISSRNIIIVLILLLCVSAGGAVYFYQQSHQDPQANAKQELDSVITMVGRLIILPTDEQPTLATVSDPEKLKDQTFFANAQKGDQVLIYMNAHKAILYRPSVNKIIEVAPVGMNGNATGTPIQ